MLKNASPNEIDDEEETIVAMEDSCKEMGLLIEKKILEHDRRKDDLTDLNNKLLQALAMYQQLIKEPMNAQPPPPQQQQQAPLPPMAQQMYPSQLPQYQPQSQYQYVSFFSILRFNHFICLYKLNCVNED